MNRHETRERLTDHIFGALETADADQVERHLVRCATCRGERATLEEGMAKVGLALRPVELPPNLGEGVLARIGAAREGKLRTSRRVRALAASTLAAALVAAGAVSWAVAERGHVGLVERQARRQVDTVKRLRLLFEALGARPYQGTLGPAKHDRKGFGSVLIYSASDGNDLILTRAVLPSEGRAAPYIVKATDRSGRVLCKGAMAQTNDGDWLFYQSTPEDLSRAFSVTVLERSGKPVIVGSVGPATGS
jgi:putative zinc finger protein